MFNSQEFAASVQGGQKDGSGEWCSFELGEAIVVVACAAFSVEEP